MRPTLSFVAPGATAIAWQELHEIQRREREIWKYRPASVALPAVSVAVGLSAFCVMLPIGSILVASARAGGEAGETEHEMRVGGPLIFLGVLGFAAFVAGAVALAGVRKQRVSREAEIKSVTDRRTLLEHLLEANGARLMRSARHESVARERTSFPHRRRC